MTKYSHEDCQAEFGELVDMSIGEDSTVSHFCATDEEYRMMRSILLDESDNDCELQPIGGAGYSGPEARGGVSGWGYRDDDLMDLWIVEIFRA